ncbi:MAG: hypothetical protein NXI14_10595, partial [bacterium]|nr:hypothetical protein [bacterium]
GSVERVVLHPLQFSRTDLGANPHPVFVALAGAVWGCVLPLGVWLVARGLKWKYAVLLRAFAGFCLVANGAYLGAAFILPVGDAADLIRLGVPVWAFAVPGILVFGAGLWVWDGGSLGVCRLSNEPGPVAHQNTHQSNRRKMHVK